MGTLGTMLNQTQKNTTTTIILKGEIKKADFEVMKRQMPHLKHIDLKDVTCQDDRIPDEAFGGKEKPNTNITTVILPLSTLYIGNAAFEGCNGLVGSLSLPDGLFYIGPRAFWNSTRLKGALSFSGKFKCIDNEAFALFVGFTGSLTLPSSLELLESGAFLNFIGFDGELSLPEQMIAIPGNAFKNFTGLSGSLNLPDGLRFISSGCILWMLWLYG